LLGGLETQFGERKVQVGVGGDGGFLRSVLDGGGPAAFENAAVVRVDTEFGACEGVFVPEGELCTEDFGSTGEELCMGGIVGERLRL